MPRVRVCAETIRAVVEGPAMTHGPRRKVKPMAARVRVRHSAPWPAYWASLAA